MTISPPNKQEKQRFADWMFAWNGVRPHEKPHFSLTADELYECWTAALSVSSATLPNAKIENLISRLKRKLDQPTIHPSENWITLGTEALLLLSEVGSSATFTIPEGWTIVPAEANVKWSGKMKAGGFDGTNFQAQQLITQVLRAAPSYVKVSSSDG